MRNVIRIVGGRGPIVMSGAAILLLLFALTTGFERGLKDEGVTAHLWQLLVAFQIPLAIAFLLTADWSHPGRVGRVLLLQGLALGLALAPVALLRL